MTLVVACSESTTETISTSSQISSSIALATTTTESTTTSTQSPTTAPSGPFQVLVFHGTAGFRHDSIPAGIDAVAELGTDHGFSVTSSEDPSVFLDAGFADFDVVVFLNTTGDILGPTEEEALRHHINSGKGFVGIHSATDTEYDWAWYGGLIGAYFMDHPAVQPATAHSTGSGHPAGIGLPPSFERVDEWYNFRSLPGPEVVVLATLDETSYQGGTMGELHPIAWAQDYDGGRSFYTAGGHTIESFSEPLFRDHLARGIVWAAGRG
jgi:type 1 glutamine amidotransferase